MKNASSLVHAALIAAACGQFAIALLNFNLIRIMGWRPDLERLPLLVREVFHVHAWFISITLAIFAVVTIRFPGELSTAPLGRWLAGGIAFFWAARTVIQVAYYSSSHWRGSPARTALHIVLLMTYAGFTAAYLAAAAGPDS